MIEPTYGPGALRGPSMGARCARVARALLGYDLLDWQRYSVDHIRARGDDGRLLYRLVVLTVARQNGKSHILRALLADALLGGGITACVMSQDRAQAREVIFEPLSDVFAAPRLAPLDVKIRRANGFERIHLRALDSRAVLLSPTEKGAHGYSLDLAVVDEAWAVFDFRVPQAITPTQVHRPDPQLVIVSTAGTEQSVWLRSLVDKGRAGEPGMLYLEWSAPGELDPGDPAAWRAANPSLEQGIEVEAIEAARRALPEGEFERAHLNRWTVAAETVISAPAWAACHEPAETIGADVVFAFDVELDRDSATIAAAGPTSSGRIAVELVDVRPGTDWVLPRLAELRDRHAPRALVANYAGPARSLVDQAAAVGLLVEPYNLATYVAACQVLYDLIEQRRLAHRGQAELDLAVAGAGRRPLGGSWAFARAHGGAQIAPLVAATLAAHRSSRPHLVPYVAAR